MLLCTREFCVDASVELSERVSQTLPILQHPVRIADRTLRAYSCWRTSGLIRGYQTIENSSEMATVWFSYDFLSPFLNYTHT